MERVMDRTKISILVAVKDAETTIARCLDSLCQQTYSDLEILIADAGSTDSSMEIAKGFASEDSRIRIVESSADNRYSAYNVAIDFSEGSYALFVDAQDLIAPDTVEVCLEQLKEQPAQILCFGYGVVDRSGSVDETVLPRLCRASYRGEQVQTEFLPRLVCIDPECGKKTRLAMSPHCSMISLDLIRRNDWQFDTELKSEIMSLLNLYKDVNVVAVVPRVLYFFDEQGKPDICRKDFETVRNNFQKEVVFCRQVGYSNMVEKALRYYFLLCSFDILHDIKHSDLPSKIRRQQLHSILEDQLIQKCIGQIANDEMDADLRVKFMKMQKKQHHVLKRMGLLDA